MRLLFATDRLHIPDDYSGSVQSTHALILELLKKNHDCEIIASLPRRAKHFVATILYRVTRHSLVLEWSDYSNGYTVRRGSSWRFVERVKRGTARYNPQALVLDSMRMLYALSEAGYKPSCPIVVVTHDTQFVNGTRNIPYGAQVTIVANSPYTAAIVTKHFGVEPHIAPPLVHLTNYVTDRAHARFVTLISPHPRKGLNLVLDLASKLPKLNFLLVEGWPMDKPQWNALLERVKPLSNVTVRRSTSDMRDIYKETWLLLVPSELETFGRVVVEAQVSGIPVFCTDVGALKWVAGAGGLAFSATDDVSEWAAQLDQLAKDNNWYSELSRRAVENVNRLDFQPEHVVTHFEMALPKTPHQHASRN